jgi:DNA (cytosine-5)-methyltransferase 1
VLTLDLYSGAGGAGMGYARAGHDVIGVDITPQPNYPFTFWRADALHLLQRLLNGERFALKGQAPIGLDDIGFIHASPPCQLYSNAQRIRDNDHPDLVPPTRELLQQTGKPWTIENVVGAPLHEPITLCGTMFPELRVYRHRLFETSWVIEQPAHPEHLYPLTKMGRKPRDDEYMHVVGNFSGVQVAREAMGIGWMVRDELREAIPPAYTKWIAEEWACRGN